MPYNPPVTQPFLSLIIPAYNEASRLPATLEQVNAFLQEQSYSWEVLVVENGSTDRTHALAEAFAKAHSGFRVLRSAKGKGAAVRTGMLATEGEWRMMLDADLSMPVSEINRFFPPKLDGADIAIASREAPGAKRHNEPQYRHFGGRLMNWLIRVLALPDLQDTQCGFKSFSARAAEALFSRQQLDSWSFDVEVLYIAQQFGYRIAELPIDWYYYEFSHVQPLKDSWNMFWDLLKIRRKAARGEYAAAH